MLSSPVSSFTAFRAPHCVVVRLFPQLFQLRRFSLQLRAFSDSWVSIVQECNKKKRLNAVKILTLHGTFFVLVTRKKVVLLRDVLRRDDRARIEPEQVQSRRSSWSWSPSRRSSSRSSAQRRREASPRANAASIGRLDPVG